MSRYKNKPVGFSPTGFFFIYYIIYSPQSPFSKLQY